MSKKHPIIAVTGSSGAGTTTVKHAFRKRVTYQYPEVKRPVFPRLTR